MNQGMVDALLMVMKNYPDVEEIRVVAKGHKFLITSDGSWQEESANAVKK